jgi:hypothetical protein
MIAVVRGAQNSEIQALDADAFDAWKQRALNALSHNRDVQN